MVRHLNCIDAGWLRLLLRLDDDNRDGNECVIYWAITRFNANNLLAFA